MIFNHVSTFSTYTRKIALRLLETNFDKFFLFVCRVFQTTTNIMKLPLSIVVATVLVPQLLLAQTSLINSSASHQPRTVVGTKTSLAPIDVVQTNVGEKCVQSSRTASLKASSDLYRQGWESAREMTWRLADEISRGDRATPPVYTIPVVFHVIHKGEAVGSGTNISTAQINSAIDALNRDYRRTNADGGIAQGAGPDTEIQFCLAGFDPQGNPHSGINRVNGTSVSGYSSNGITSSNEGSVKALSRWDNRYYMNIWVVSEIDNNGADLANPSQWGGGTLGYAYQPTNPVTWNSDLDGIVAVNLCVGNDPNQSNGYRLWPWGGLTNRTLTHEVGHFLALDHTFEGQSCSESNCNTQGDGICDTPPTVQGSTCNSPACSNTQVENYMDYTSETCQDQFTSGQSTVMRGVLAGVRSDLVNTSNCASISTNDYDAGVSSISTPNGTICETTFSPVVTLNNYGTTTLTSAQIQYYVDANAPTTYNWSGSLASNASVSVTLNPVTTTTGNHTFTARTVSTSLNGSNTDQDTGNDQTSGSFTVSSGGSGITLTLNLDCYGSDVTWEIRNASNSVVASGGPYTDNPNGEQIVEGLCLPQGCYDFNVDDVFGDGLYGSQYFPNCSIDGDYSITDGSSTLVQMSAANGDYGFGTTHNFCIGGGSTGSPTCEVLAAFEGESFIINPTDEPNFNAQIIDNDQEAVATQLANAGYSSNWMLGFYNVVAPGDTNWFVGSTSWHVNTSAPADNWLTFGPVTMLDDDGELRWKHRYSDNDYRDGYEVLVGTSGVDVADFSGATVLYSVGDNAGSTAGDTVWTSQSVTLPAGTYANQSLYFAFHHDALDMFLLFLDDIEVEGCSSLTVGIDENEEFNFNVFPNPSTGDFTVQFAGKRSQDFELIMLNAVGQTVWSKQIKDQALGVQTITTENLPSGIYTLIMKGDNLNDSKRLVLTK